MESDQMKGDENEKTDRRSDAVYGRASIPAAGPGGKCFPKLILSEAEVRVATGKSVTLKATVENPPAGKRGKPPGNPRIPRSVQFPLPEP